MPISFSTIPVSQIKKPAPKKSPSISKPKVTKTQSLITTRRTTNITAIAYGGKLFEPVMSKEKATEVHFHPQFSPDGCRFSSDGFFAIKYLHSERRAYLIYFINPVRVTDELTIEKACQEAIEFKTFEFEDSEAYRRASLTIDLEGIKGLRKESALGRVIEKIIEILREKLVAEKFLLRQKFIEQQDESWKIENQKRLDLEAKEEKEKEDELAKSALGFTNSKSDEPKHEHSEEAINEIKNEEASQALFKEGEKEKSNLIQREEIRENGKKEVKSFWGGRK